MAGSTDIVVLSLVAKVQAERDRGNSLKRRLACRADGARVVDVDADIRTVVDPADDQIDRPDEFGERELDAVRRPTIDRKAIELVTRVRRDLDRPMQRDRVTRRGLHAGSNGSPRLPCR